MSYIFSLTAFKNPLLRKIYLKFAHFCALLVCALLALGISFPVHAALEITINQGSIAPTPIAIVLEPSEDAEAQAALARMQEVIESDFSNTGLFALIPASAFIQKPETLSSGLHYSEWRLIKADKILTLKVVERSFDKLRIEARLYDSIQEKMIEGRSFSADLKNWRRIAHKIADMTYQKVTGDPGYFDTQIVYVSYSQKGIKRQERIAIMDYDGANHFYLTDGKNLVMTPRFSPNRRYVTYLDYQNKKPRVFLYDRAKNKKILVGHFPGMTFAPRFSYDGKHLVLSFSQNGNTSLFEMDLETLKMKQLTSGPVIDTSPSYAPTGDRLVFNSDRTGRTQLYVLDLAKGEPERISFGEGSYRTPVWSPRGDWIAFTKMYQGEFYIGVIRPDGSGERLITKGYLVEAPSWSPNGHAILFTRDDRQGKPRLHAIDFTGFNERQISTPDNAIQGDWSMLR